MTRCCPAWPVLILALSLFAASPGSLRAQQPGRPWAPPRLHRPSFRIDRPREPRASYRPLQDEPEDFGPGADLEVQGRLQAQKLRELTIDAQKLARDPHFIEELRNSLTPEQVTELKKKLLSGQEINSSPEMQRLVEKLRTSGSLQGLSPESIKMLQQLATRTPGLPSTGPHSAVVPPGSSPPSIPPPGSDAADASSQPPSDSRWERLQGRAADWIFENLHDSGNDVLRALEKMQGQDQDQTMRGWLGRLMPSEGDLRNRLAAQAQGFSRYVPHLNVEVPALEGAVEPLRSLWGQLSMPSLPGMHGSSSVSGSSASTAGAGAGASTVLFAVLALLVLFLVGRQLQVRRAAQQAAAGAALGPWPVLPEAVTSRQQLVRAFDYLALLCLGLRARTWNHLEVAAQLASRQGDPAHEQAAHTLARLYEQARYAPAPEALRPEELAAARSLLRFFAGASAS